MKMYIFISNPEYLLTPALRFLAFTCSPDEDFGQNRDRPDYRLIAECEVDESKFDIDSITDDAIAIITLAEQKERAEHQVKMDMLDEKKRSFLAITHEPLKVVK